MTSPAASATVDLQVHSTASDGAVHPADIPAFAVAAGLSAFALTDHDSVAGVLPARHAAPAHLRIVAGVELSAMHGDNEVHLLGLHVDALESLDASLETFRTQRAERAVAIVAKLNALGIGVTLDEVARQAGDGAIGRPHVARALLANGVVKDFRDAFDRYIGAGRAAYVPKPRLAVRDATRLVHEAGGLAVWAHPGPDGRRDAVEALVAQGLDGVEIRHPGHSSDDEQRLRALCDHFRLVPSGGSDWHGEREGRRTLGAMKVPAEWLEVQDERVAARRAAGVS